MKVLALTLCLALAIVVTGNLDLLWAVTTDQSSLVLKEAEDVARTVEDEGLRAYTLGHFAEGYARNDVWDQAERLATSVPPGFEHDRAYRLFVALRVEQGNISEALRLRSAMGNGLDFIITAGVIVSGQSQGEGIAAARRTALAWPDGPVRARALLLLASAQVDQEDFQGALQTVRMIPVIEIDGLVMSPNEVLSRIISHQLDQGSYQDARETTELYWDAHDRIVARRRVQVFELQQGEMAEVLIRLRTVEDSALRDAVLQWLAKHHARRDDLDFATKMINSISSLSARQFAREEMFAAMAEAGYITNALEGARKIDPPVEQPAPIRRIVLSGASQLDREPFFQLLSEQEPILKYRQGQPYDMLLSEVAKLRTTRKDVVGAMRAIERMNDERTRNIALVKLAGAQASAGDLAEARWTLGRMTRSEELVFGVRDIVSEHAKRGQFGAARELVSRQTGDTSSTLIDRAQQYEEIAYWQAKRGDNEGALRWARVLPASIERAFAVFGAGLGSIASLPPDEPVRK
jgi:hypothetical protein